MLDFKNKITQATSFLRRLFLERGRYRRSPVKKIHAQGRKAFSLEKQTELDLLCAQLFKKKEFLTSGKLQFIGLEKIRKRMGKSWAGLSRIVYDTAEEVMSKHLDKNDLFIRFHDESYIIIFANSSLEEGQRTAAVIAEEIRQRLFSLDEEELRKIEIRQAISEIKVSDLADQGFMDFMDFAFEGPDPYQQGTLPDEEKQEIKLSEIPKIEIGAADYKKKPKEYKSAQPIDLNCAYLPLWDVQRNALTTYLCLARGASKDKNLLNAHENIYRGQSADSKVALDRKILDVVRLELAQMEKDNRKLLIACPVKYKTLHEFESYEAYKEQLALIPLQQRQFLILLVQLDDNMPTKEVYWFATPLRQFCRHIFAEVPLRRDINFNYLRNSGVDVTGIRLDDSLNSEQEIMNLLSGFSSKAKSLKIPKTFILGVSTLSLTTSSVCAGFDFLGGSAIHDEVPRPDSVHRYRHEDLLTALTKTSAH